MQKQKIKKGVIATLIVIFGIAAAVFIHQNTWFEFKPTRAEIPMTSEIQANSTTAASSQHDLAIDEEGNTVVVWYQHNGTDQDTYFRLFDSSGTPIGTETIATSNTSGDQFNSSVAADEAGNFVIAFTGYNSVSGTWDIFVRAFQPDGTPIGNDVVVNTTTSGVDNSPKVALDYNGPFNSSRFVVSWTHHNGSDLDTYYRLMNVDFTQTTTAPTAFSSETILHTGYSGDQLDSNVAMNNLGQFIVTTQHAPGSGGSVLYRIFAQDGTALTALIEITEGGYLMQQPAVAADKKARATLNDTEDIRFILSYIKNHAVNGTYNIATKIINCTDPNTANTDDTDITCSSNNTEILDTRANTISKSSPDVDADYLGNFTVAWTDSSIDGNDSGIAGQSYNYKGAKVGEPFQINGTVTTGSQGPSEITLNTDGFYDVSFFDFNNDDVHFKKYVNEIFKVENETLAHTADNVNTQSTVATAISPTHNQVIVWMDYGTSPASLKYTLQQIDQSDPANPAITILKDEQVIATGNNINNPDVDFFKDDSNCNRYIVVWENDLGAGNGKDILYNIFDSAGNAEYGSPQSITATTDAEVNPTVSAGIYNNGSTDVKIFSAGWQNTTDSSIESKYHNNGTFYATTVSSECSNGIMCVNVENSLNPNNNRVVFAFGVLVDDGNSNIFIQQLDSYTLVGNAVEVNSATSQNNGGDISFITDDDFALVYTTGLGADVRGSRYTYDAISGGDGNQNPDLVENFSISQNYFSSSSQETNAKISAYPTNTASLQQLLIVWNLTYPTNDIHTLGQYLDYSGSSIEPFGPSFRINTSRISDSFLPDVGYNRYGLGIVAWEGESATDSWGIQYQLLQNPDIIEEMAPLEPVCRQEITAGGLTMSAPSSISFPAVSVSATETEIQEISVRDATYGGDMKYLEIQDATGEDFTLSIMISDFTADADNKIYIKADEHFKVKNWDDSTTATNPTCDSGNPLNCFLTENSTYSPTAFSLSSETQNYAFANTQKVLATKTTTQQSEIGRWKIYPKFWISVPPIIPAGLHEATITFTLVN